MSSSRISLWTLIGFSLLLALILSVFPLPYELRWWRPEFVLVVVIYWMLFMPLTISLVFVCLIGLFQDLLESVPFGQHSLGLILVAYICILSYQRVRNFSVWKQSCWVFVLIGIAQLTDNWVQGMAGRALSGISFLYPAFTSALLWPLCQWWLNGLCRRHQLQ